VTQPYLSRQATTAPSPHAQRPPRQRLRSNALVLTGLATLWVVGLTGNWPTGLLLGKKSRLSGRIRRVEKIAQAHANEAKPLLRVETDAFAQ
jgi:hypothetical protein